MEQGQPQANFAMGFEAGPGNISYGLWCKHVVDNRGTYTFGEDWPIDVEYREAHDKLLGFFDEVVQADTDTEREKWENLAILGTKDGAMVHLNLARNFLYCKIATKDPSQPDQLVKELGEMFPRPPVPEDQRVWITFWAMSGNGPRTLRRRVDVPTWQQVQSNYTDVVRQDLGMQMLEFKPAFGGQLLLWHGPPGTGKTFAIRALAWEWRKWCDFHYVTDPETLFGREPAYLLDVLLQENRDLIFNDDGSEGDKERWKLLILEDTGEMLVPDAKQQVGQGLSRLLNTVDGLLGQGLRVLVMVTTNETLETLHPAIARPGRCAAKTQFQAMDKREAEQWLKEHDKAVQELDRGKYTLAELFAMNEEREVRMKTRVGFMA